MKQRVRRLEDLARGAGETDAQAFTRYVRGLSDEELDRQCEEIRVQVGEVAHQELLDEVRRRMRKGP